MSRIPLWACSCHSEATSRAIGRSVTTTWRRSRSRSRTTRSIAAGWAYENPSLLSTIRGSVASRISRSTASQWLIGGVARSSANDRRPVTARTALDEWRDLPA